MESNLVQIILISAVVFLAITLILVAILLFAKDKLLPTGTVKIDINNGKKVIETNPGYSLLATLANQKIFLPSACGGKGSCGQCKCQVIKGGGSILPTEEGFFNRKQKQDHWRLGCQVKVKEDLGILVPESVLSIKKWECEVVSNRNVATYIKEFCVKIPDGEHMNYRSGGYIQIDIPPCEIDYKNIEISDKYRADWERMHMFDLKMKSTETETRAYSMASYPAEGNIIKLNVRIATPPFDRAKKCFRECNPGVASSYIFSRKPGDKVMISGPYGEFFIPDNCPEDQEFIFIGGGAGMAPMRSHILHLFKTVKTKRKVSFWYGARSLKEAFYLEDYEEIARENPNFTFHLALDNPLPEDNWTGYKGFVHKFLYDEYLGKHEYPEDVMYFLCGPPMMTSSCVNMLTDLGVAPENILYDNFGA
ncbi:MAG: NADH:ubiquinone reductase (Na(+)-transporting) subunit F [Bacteroidales bacterium]|jgi:Na+-transporting NADH:ubiquinone oxidoreductase subunit F|nr:NADH:ubiquinone reductase (Na(+)-transporting) subunit F [Bacteroidales bacterium]